MRDYYIYIYYRLDTNEPFYIGKGRKGRWKRLNRENTHFNNIVNKHDVAVEIIKYNLTEEEAFYWEEEIIRILVFEYGYSIEIINNRSIDESQYHLVNATWGGDGTKGMNPFENKTHDEMKIIKEKMSKSHSGEKHYMYGNGYKIKGDKNPFYGKHHSDKTKNKLSEINKGKGTKKVINVETEEVFNSAEEASKKYNIKYPHNIRDACKENTKEKSAGGYHWMYYDEWIKLNDKEKESIKNKKINNKQSVTNLDTGEIFTSITEASKKYNINRIGISDCCRGKSKTAGGYRWSYYND